MPTKPYQPIEVETIRRRRTLADALLAQSLAPIGAAGVGRSGPYEVQSRVSPLEPLAKLVQAYFGNQQAEKADTELAAHEQRQREREIAAWGGAAGPGLMQQGSIHPRPTPYIENANTGAGGVPLLPGYEIPKVAMSGQQPQVPGADVPPAPGVEVRPMESQGQFVPEGQARPNTVEGEIEVQGIREPQLPQGVQGPSYEQLIGQAVQIAQTTNVPIADVIASPYFASRFKEVQEFNQPRTIGEGGVERAGGRTIFTNRKKSDIARQREEMIEAQAQGDAPGARYLKGSLEKASRPPAPTGKMYDEDGNLVVDEEYWNRRGQVAEKGATRVQTNIDAFGKPAMGKLEEGMIDAADGIRRIQAVRDSFDPDYLTYGTQIANALRTGKERIGLDLSPQAKAKLEEFSKFKRQTLTNLNLYIKQITGAAMSEAEAGRITKAMPNMDDSATAFKAKLDSVLDELQSTLEAYDSARKGGPGALEPYRRAEPPKATLEDIGNKPRKPRTYQIEELPK